MMSEYCVIYDTYKQKYFVSDNLCIEVIAKFEIQNAFEIKNALFALGNKYKRGE